MNADSITFDTPIIDCDDIEGFVPPATPESDEDTLTFKPSCFSRGLSVPLILEGYRKGAFPWPDDQTESTGLYPWGRLFPCTLLHTSQLHLTHSMKRRVKAALRHRYEDYSLEILLDEDFDAVIEEIAAYHQDRRKGTWMTEELISQWKALHEAGHAHVIAVYIDDVLAGGLYFTSIGRMIYGESMFSKANDASKLALTALCAFGFVAGFPVIDCQMPSEHIMQAGAAIVPGEMFFTLNTALTNMVGIDWERAKGLSLIPFMEKRYPELLPRESPQPEDVPERRFVKEGGLLFETLSVHTSCSYYDDGRDCVMDVIPLTPTDTRIPMVYDRVIGAGFRRDSDYLYRLRCPTCRRCIPTRLDVSRFHPDASMRRTWNRNRSLVLTEHPLRAMTDEQFELYQRYQQGRHAGGDMSKMTREQVNKVLFSSCTNSAILELRTPAEDESPNELKMVCIIDRLDDAISAVYTFFDPDVPKLSLGTFGILSEIEYARQNGLSYVYLGYWLPSFPGMDYKKRFNPMEVFWNGQWMPISTFEAEPKTLENIAL